MRWWCERKEKQRGIKSKLKIKAALKTQQWKVIKVRENKIIGIYGQGRISMKIKVCFPAEMRGEKNTLDPLKTKKKEENVCFCKSSSRT